MITSINNLIIAASGKNGAVTIDKRDLKVLLNEWNRLDKLVKEKQIIDLTDQIPTITLNLEGIV